MKTRCPRCSTRYQIDASAIDRAGGKARCYKCGLIFDAASNAFDEPLETTLIDRIDQAAPAAGAEPVEPPADAPQPTPDAVAPAPSAATAATGSVDAPVDEADATGADGRVWDAPGPADPVLTYPLSDAPSAADAAPGADATPTPAPEPPPESPPEPPTTSPGAAATPALSLADGLPSRAGDAAWPPQPKVSDTDHEPLLSVPRPRRVPRWCRWAFWSLAALAIGQIAWLQRDALLTVPELRDLADQACNILDCQLPPAPQAGPTFVVIDREILPAEDHPNHLQVSIDFANRSAAAAPMPDVWLGLYNTEERLIASRRLKPVEYAGTAEGHRVDGGEVVAVRLLIEDPGEAVTGFKLEFLATPGS